ncbi:hypothetical protein OIU79_012635 [Salix purpurea]|uniref:Macrophage migration inhibitory factor family protein n=1 Tax=Salix purpurea TaxID=77065 RepID=A0A9Q0Q3N9_SALPP|nr:hypothetical protein OIU79_012635 [Salix purpurea]
MPCLNISTNVSLDGINTSAILSEASSQVAKIIGKPESYVMIVGDVNKKLSSAIATILESKLSVPKSRFFLKFFDSKGSHFGWNGSTF